MKSAAPSNQAMCIDKTESATSIQSSSSEFKDSNAENDVIGKLIADCTQQKARKHPL